MWCVTEFASALGIKQRTKQISSAQAAIAWQSFERLCAADLQLLLIDSQAFHLGAMLTLDPVSGLRAGDALHLAVAQEAKVKEIATLDDILAKNAKILKIKSIAF